MTEDRVAVRYYCPRCETVVTIPRDPYLNDKTVTPYPLEGWRYASPDEDYEREEFDGVRFMCGQEQGPEDWDGEGCGEPFYLSFVRYEESEARSASEEGSGQRPRPRQEVEPERESEFVELAGEGPSDPRSPRGPGGPTG